MKKWGVIICFMFISVTIFGQDHGGNIQNYYSKLYKAQSFIVDKKLDSASIIFNGLTSLYNKKSNVIDIYNALVLNFINKNRKQVRFCLKLLSSKNVSIARLLNIKAIDSLVHINPNFVGLKDINKYDRSYKLYPCVKELDSAYQIDQNVRFNKENYTSVQGKRAMYLVDSINAYFLTKYLDMYGFNDYEEVLYDTINNISKLETMILHQTTWKRSQYINRIEKGIEDLEIKPGIAYYIIDLFKGSSKHETIALYQFKAEDSGCNTSYKNKWLSFEYGPEILDRINNIRKNDLLENWDFYIRKSAFSLHNTLFNWHSPFTISVLNFASCSELTSFLNNPKFKIKIIE